MIVFVQRLIRQRAMAVLGALLLGLSLGVSAQQTWTVNFKDTDIQEVIKFVADATGKTIVVDPKVRGQVRVISQEPVNREELYQLFLSIIDVQGFTAVETGQVVRVVPNRDARSLPVPTGSDSQEADDTYVTQVIKLKNISASRVLPTLRPLVPQHGHLSAYDASNAIIVTDTRANIKRLQKIIAQIDQSSVTETELIYLDFAPAEDLAGLITQLMQSSTEESGRPQLSLVPYARTNAILVHGDEMQRRRVKRLVENLDRPSARNSNVRVVYLKYAQAENVAQVLNGMAQNIQGEGQQGQQSQNSEVNIQADEDTNSLLITADGDTMEALLSVVDSLDIRRAQVLVEAIIVEMEDTDGQELGIQWLYRDDSGGFASSSRGDGSAAAIGQGALDDTDDGLNTLASAVSQVSGEVFGVGRLEEDGDFLVLLNMLQENSSTNILSTPNLLTTDNNTASISVGQNIPFATGSFSSTGGGSSNPVNPFRTIERRDVGILLEVTPQINTGDSLVLDISQEVSSVSSLNNPDGPITNQRTIETQVMAGNGETIVLGGLIEEEVQTSEQRVPFLGSIPVMGHLFRNQTNSISKTNLLVFIRATVIEDDQMLRGATAEKYKALRKQQEQRRGSGGMIFDDRQIPLLPEWQEQLDRTTEIHRQAEKVRGPKERNEADATNETAKPGANSEANAAGEGEGE